MKECEWEEAVVSLNAAEREVSLLWCVVMSYLPVLLEVTLPCVFLDLFIYFTPPPPVYENRMFSERSSRVRTVCGLT